MKVWIRIPNLTKKILMHAYIKKNTWILITKRMSLQERIMFYIKRYHLKVSIIVRQKHSALGTIKKFEYKFTQKISQIFKEKFIIQCLQKI